MIETIPEELQPAMLKEFKTGWNFRKVVAEAQSQQIGVINQQRHRSLDGIGRLKLRVDADSYHYWGQRLGYQCWADKGFVDSYMKKNSYSKVNSGGTKEVHVGFVAPRQTPRNVKYSKTFA